MATATAATWSADPREGDLVASRLALVGVRRLVGVDRELDCSGWIGFGRFVPETVPMAAARSSGGLELRTASAPMV
jgi:hypothetical protein